MVRVRGIAVVLTLAVMLVLSMVPVRAQEGTPVATPTADRIVPLPSECTVTPRSSDSLLKLATPEAGAATATPAAPAIPFGAFAGTPVDAETAAEYTAFIRLFWACNNTGDITRILPLLTEDEIRQSFLPEDIIFFAQPLEGTPVPFTEEELASIFAILGIEDLGNAQVGAYVVVDTPSDPLPVEVNYMIATETPDGWRLDEFVCFDAVGGYCA
jgi:hypothetical protein